MKKTAVIYDKWLSSLGGGEMVACTLANILVKQGYEVTFICGKRVSSKKILNNFKVDLSKVNFLEVWNNDQLISNITKGKDLFINISFMDYTFAKAKKNIYYVHFPTKPYDNIKGFIFTYIIIPIVKNVFNIYELISDIDTAETKNKRPAFRLTENTRIAYPFLTIGKNYDINISLILENFYKLMLENIKITFDDAQIIKRKVYIDHNTNQVDFNLTIKPQAKTAYLNINHKIFNNHSFGGDALFMLYPKSLIAPSGPIYRKLNDYVNSKLRSGIFLNTLTRLGGYNQIVVHSNFVKKWVKKYWDKDSQVLFPPVDLLHKKYQINKYPKKNIICTVGRFFTLGHGKKQEVMVRAFKQIYDKGYKDWELHLVGGVGQEPSSREFVERLVEESNGYPIFFHFNASRKEVEEIYLKSKIYWHAAGFGVNKEREPVKLEHFGITVVEALSARCIPIVYDGGGIKEILELTSFPLDNSLFISIQGLISNTIYHINKNQPNVNWKRVAKVLEDEFSIESFERKFLKLIKK